MQYKLYRAESVSQLNPAPKRGLRAEKQRARDAASGALSEDMRRGTPRLSACGPILFKSSFQAQGRLRGGPESTRADEDARLTAVSVL
eukprot:1704107-Rhodomonas_salina.4